MSGGNGLSLKTDPVENVGIPDSTSLLFQNAGQVNSGRNLHNDWTQEGE